MVGPALVRRCIPAAIAAGIVVAVGAAAAACGEPEDPVIPTLDAGVDSAGDAPEAVPSCTGAADGTPCEGGPNKVCVGNVCTDTSCGDGVVTPPEECDLGPLNAPGAGCEATCRFSCVAGDATRKCTSTIACVGDGTCDPQNHTCSAGAPLPTGASCGTGKFCAGGVCTSSNCGDAVVTPPEQCDNGAANGPGTGCETGCTFTCSNAAVDCPAVPCTTPACSATHTCAPVADPTKNGQTCGTSLVCSDGACIAPGAVCGNGTVEGGEDCDLGTGFNGAGTGCETTCKFSCTKAPDSCVDQDPCHAAPTCTTVTVNGKPGQKCVTGATKSDGAVCGTGSICLAGACAPSVCGDAYRDDARMEQCDDGNIVNLDACSSTCKFEQDQRAVALKMQFGTDAYCTINALGKAVGFFAQGSLQGSIDTGVKDGSISVLFTFSGDPTGTSGAVTVGNLSGAPAPSAAYDGTADLDWWYPATATSIDASRVARATLTGTYAGGALDATGRLNLLTSIGGSLANLAVSSAKIHFPIGASTTPTASASGSPPGHVAAEHLSPTLTSFAATGNVPGTPTAQMCGNVSAASLNDAVVPSSLLPGGSNACKEGYTSNNRMIDVFVHGCHVGSLSVTAIRATQPDQSDPSAPAAGAGAPYSLQTDATTKRVTTCKDKNGAVVSLPTCLTAAAYSSSFKLATDRVVIK